MTEEFEYFDHLLTDDLVLIQQFLLNKLEKEKTQYNIGGMDIRRYDNFPILENHVKNNDSKVCQNKLNIIIREEENRKNKFKEKLNQPASSYFYEESKLEVKNTDNSWSQVANEVNASFSVILIE